MSKNISFKDFLKKYSTLSNLFIEDFYTIYNYNENENEDFIINIDVISKWLEIPRGKIKKTLINTYNKNIDYIIEFDKNNKISKSNKENILLTPDCFKRLCLLSRTKKAEEVFTFEIYKYSKSLKILKYFQVSAKLFIKFYYFFIYFHFTIMVKYFYN